MLQNSLFIKKQFFCSSKLEHIEKYYQFLHQLGSGTYGTVFKAKLLSKQNTYRAIKRIPKHNIRNYNQFITQIQILKQLDHPNIMKLYQTYQNDSYLYLVTDLFQGGELFQVLEKRGEFNQQEAREIFIQVLQAVNYCHLMNVCHRDIKAENLLFLNSQSLNLKLIDFGLSFKWKTNMKKQIKSKRQASVVGTPYYIAPQIFTKQYDQRCDIWSLGVLLYIIVTANAPFNGDSQKIIIERIKKIQYSIDCQQTQGLSVELKDLIKRTLVPADKRISLKQIFSHRWIVKKDLSSKKQLKLNFKKLAKFTKFSQLKTVAVTYIASQLGQKDLHKLGELFRTLDLNHDGYLSVDQIKIACKKQKQRLNTQDLTKLLQYIDTDKNGKINYTQFISSCLQNSLIYREQNLLSVFKMLDRDNNGLISVEQLKKVLILKQKQEQKFQFNYKVVEQIMLKCDKNKDGKIDYLEFLESVSDV